MKKFLLVGLLTLTGGQLFSQTSVVSGRIADVHNKPVAFAFIADITNKSATYSDSLGSFNLKANPEAKLTVKAYNFNDTVVNVNNQTNLNINLRGDGSTQKAARLNTSIVNNSDSFNSRINTMAANTNAIAVTRHQDATQGSRYLYDTWVHGYVTSAADSIVENIHYLFNYDKISGNLLVNKDDNTVLQIDGSSFKTFILFDGQAKAHPFAKVPAISPQRYVEVIADGAKYKIYKDLATKFHKADFATNGIASTGNNYDEYIDQNFYYVVKDGGQPVKLQLKKKAIKEVFAADADKLNKFMAAAGSSDIDEVYLTQLGEALNQ
ncbi:hypothetical protein [Mucilaginibacter celer]|uniref:Carboxypeptidase-like regulatory domain-containing protein n=1 Tax=Mucilaginibacter celer TaxID=2305508 RepID=A0A494W4E2_9SPHI|nr:hypothetical protein [Mucilaginibacter celer]AYL98408.1 hypothetical protein HYN43_025355 [Mucilaginibacter celer]